MQLTTRDAATRSWHSRALIALGLALLAEACVYARSGHWRAAIAPATFAALCALWVWIQRPHSRIIYANADERQASQWGRSVLVVAVLLQVVAHGWSLVASVR